MKSNFKKFSIVLALVFVFSISSIKAQAAKVWNVDKSHSSINFSIKHFFSTVTGKFKKFDGTVKFDAKDLKNSSVEFSIPISGVDTDDEDRDGHLQSADFFDAKNYPNMTFKSTKIVKVSDKEFVAHGKLKIRKTTKEIKLPFKITGEIEHPMKKGTVLMGISAEKKINRTEFGVGTGSFAATAVVGDEVDIKIFMELTRKK